MSEETSVSTSELPLSAVGPEDYSGNVLFFSWWRGLGLPTRTCDHYTCSIPETRPQLEFGLFHTAPGEHQCYPESKVDSAKLVFRIDQMHKQTHRRKQLLKASLPSSAFFVKYSVIPSDTISDLCSSFLNSLSSSIILAPHSSSLWNHPKVSLRPSLLF